MFSGLSTICRSPPLLSNLLHPRRLHNYGGCYVVDPTKFYLLLINRPHVANYVRVARILILRLDGYCTSVIASILSNLSQIESITFNAMSRPALDQEFSTALRNSIQIKEVTISRIDVKVSFQTLQAPFPLDCIILRSQVTGESLSSFGLIFPWLPTDHIVLVSHSPLPLPSSATFHTDTNDKPRLVCPRYPSSFSPSSVTPLHYLSVNQAGAVFWISFLI